MGFKLNAATRLSADTETSKDGKAVSPANGFREQNEDNLKDRQQDSQKSVDEKPKAETTADAEGDDGASTGDTTITLDIPQDNDDDMSSIDAVVTAAVKRLHAEQEVEADADPKLFNMANQPMGPMA
jgi:hypothetical protein